MFFFSSSFYLDLKDTIGLELKQVYGKFLTNLLGYSFLLLFFSTSCITKIEGIRLDMMLPYILHDGAIP